MEKLFAFECLDHCWVDASKVFDGTREAYEERVKGRIGFFADIDIRKCFRSEVLQEIGGQALVKDRESILERERIAGDELESCEIELLLENQYEWLKSQLLSAEQSGEPALVVVRQFVAANRALSLNGNKGATRNLHSVAVAAVRALEKVRSMKPELCSEVAQHVDEWPVALAFGRRPYKKDQSREGFLRELRLAEKRVPYSQQSTRERNPLPTEMAKDLANFVFRHSPGFNERKSFGADWWKECLRVFKFAYPFPERIPELKALVSSEKNRATPAKHRAAIISVLQKRFMRLIP